MPLKTVMVVDDSEAEQFLYKHMLQSYDANINVISAYDGKEALNTLETSETKPDCILLDINMPRMNGFEFLDSYVEQFKDHHISVAMLTSSSQDNDKERALSYECVKHYFLKPITTEDLEILTDIVN